MKRSAEYKVPGGKLLRIEAELSGSTIEKVKIHGDFFLHPEEAIFGIEASLAGMDIYDSRLPMILSKASEGACMVGISAEDIMTALGMLGRGY